MYDYDDWTDYTDTGYNEAFDYDNDGKHDFFEHSLMEDDVSYDTYRSSSRRRTSGSGLSIGTSIIIGLIIYLDIFLVLQVDADDIPGELAFFIWVVSSLLVYYGSKTTK